MRKNIAAGNWKMNLDNASAHSLASEVADANKPENVTVIMAAPSVYLQSLVEATKGKGVHIAAQNCSDKEKGAYTGEISTSMLKSIGVEYVVIGHSERREYYGESDEVVHAKLRRLLDDGMKVILCCGESLDIRKAGTQNEYVIAQLEKTLMQFTADELDRVVVAYEPIWAIGTGETASPQQAQDMHQALRSAIASHFDQDTADRMSILYGGSVKPANAKEIFSQNDVDGGLVGGASLKADDFKEIIHSF